MNLKKIIAIAALLAPVTMLASKNAGAQVVGNPTLGAGEVAVCAACHSIGTATLGPQGANPLWAGNSSVANIDAMMVYIGPMKPFATLPAQTIADISAYLTAQFPTDPAGGNTALQAKFGQVAAVGSAMLTVPAPAGMCVACHSRGIPSDSISGAINETGSMRFLANIGGGTIAWLNAARAAGMTSGPSTTPNPSRTPAPSTTPNPSRTPAPSATPTPTRRPSATPEPTRRPSVTPTPTHRPTATPRPRPTRPRSVDE